VSKNPVVQGSYGMNVMREPVLRSLIHDLDLPEGRHGLDNACGIGLRAIMLAEEVGSNGHVTGIDISTEILDIGRKIIDDAGLSELSPYDINEFKRLCNPDSQDFILNIPDYYAHFTCTAFSGTKP